MDERSKQILARYAGDALDILDHSLTLFDQGHRNFYRVAAVQLRILLCDTNFRHNKQEDIALIPELLPELLLYPVNAQGFPQPDLSPVDLKTWLDLPAGTDPPLSVRQLIRRVCDTDGGVHVDVKPLAGLPESGNTRQWIINIARYISSVLTPVFQ
jgi:hypothetical protein